MYDAVSNENKKKLTNMWIATHRQLTDVCGKNVNFHEMKIDDLDYTLGQFYAELRKQDGTDYEPDCL